MACGYLALLICGFGVWAGSGGKRWRGGHGYAYPYGNCDVNSGENAGAHTNCRGDSRQGLAGCYAYGYSKRRLGKSFYASRDARDSRCKRHRPAHAHANRRTNRHAATHCDDYAYATRYVYVNGNRRAKTGSSLALHTDGYANANAREYADSDGNLCPRAYHHPNPHTCAGADADEYSSTAHFFDSDGYAIAHHDASR